MVGDPALASCSPCGGGDINSLMSYLSWFHVQLGQPGVISTSNFVEHKDVD